MKYVEKSSTGTHSVGYEYDDINNLTALVETIGTVERKTSYTYDGDNRPTSVIAGNSTLDYVYDNFGRVSTLTTKHDNNAFATKTYSYKLNTDGKPTNQVSNVTIQIGSNSETFTYTYDQNGNITGIDTTTKVGDKKTTHTTSYAYDSANQLIREDNQKANTTTVWTYDNAGNILTRTVRPYVPGTEDEEIQTNYYYTDTQWGDLLKSYAERPIMRDESGNPTNDFVWRYTWQHGRQLASMNKLDGSAQWNYTYNADGLRTQRTGFATDSTTGVTANRTYNYTYLGDQLTHMTVDGHTMYFTYDAAGTPLTMVYDGLKFYYITNLQGDVISIVDGNGTEFVRYTYDAWGKVEAFGSATNLRFYNPLRYRGYVYDPETELYYLQSRYYDPEMGRFINADGLTSTGQGVLGNNMFSYCGNNPVIRIDSGGYYWETVFDVISLVVSIVDVVKHPDDPMAWVGLVADVASLVIPVVACGGAIVKVATKADDVVDAVRTVDKIDDAVDTAKAIDNAQAVAKIHGNSLSTTKETVGYALRKNGTNEIMKFGETTRGIKRYTNKFYIENDVYMDIMAHGSKYDMHYWQHDQILRYNQKYGHRPPWNKSFW